MDDASSQFSFRYSDERKARVLTENPQKRHYETIHEDYGAHYYDDTSTGAVSYLETCAEGWISMTSGSLTSLVAAGTIHSS